MYLPCSVFSFLPSCKTKFPPYIIYLQCDGFLLVFCIVQACQQWIFYFCLCENALFLFFKDTCAAHRFLVNSFFCFIFLYFEVGLSIVFWPSLFLVKNQPFFILWFQLFHLLQMHITDSEWWYNKVINF